MSRSQLKQWTAVAAGGTAILIVIAAGIAAIEGPEYVGAKKCGQCHRNPNLGNQYGKWESILHSKSYDALTSPNAMYAANAMGVKEPAKDPKCLRCHAPLFDKAPDFAYEGVSCEVCHGAGSEFAKLSVMTDRELAVKNGLKLYDGSPDKILAFCLGCHDNPHGNPFEFTAAWEKIKHPRPKK